MDLAIDVQAKAKAYADAHHDLEVAESQLADWQRNVIEASARVDSCKAAVDKALQDLRQSISDSAGGGT